MAKRRRGLLTEKDSLMMPGFHTGKGKAKGGGTPTGSGFAAMRARQKQRKAEAAAAATSRKRKRKNRGGFLSPARESLLVNRETRIV